jgi:hypothetical protein
MIKKIKIGKHLEIVLEEMCRRVGTELKRVDILEKDWQEKHTWTYDEEVDFQSWFYQYLIQNKEAVSEFTNYKLYESVSTNDVLTLAKEFTLFYGWKLTEERGFEYIIENNPTKN